MDTFLTQFRPHWALIQKKYGEQLRWQDYLEQNPNLPRQTNLEHSLSVKRLFEVACGLLRCHGRAIDSSLITLAIDLHEDGEMFEGDTLWHNKTNDSHEKELHAFLQHALPAVPKPLHELWRHAFLLQYAHDATISFRHQESQQDLEMLRKTCATEARVFDFLERLDYLLYADTAFKDYGDVVLRTHVLRNQHSYLQQHLADFSWFQNLLPKISLVEHDEFIKNYADIPGPKDEGGILAAYGYARARGYL